MHNHTFNWRCMYYFPTGAPICVGFVIVCMPRLSRTEATTAQEDIKGIVNQVQTQPQVNYNP